MPTISPADCTYETFDHKAQIGLRLEAATGGDLFTCAGLALFELIQPAPADTAVSPPRSVGAAETADWRQVALSADDPESLLVAWLDALLNLHATTGLLFRRYNVVAWEPTFIEATVMGDTPERPSAPRIRAVTHHELEVVQTAGSWQARVFFDVFEA